VAHLDLHHQLVVLAHLRTLAERAGRAVLLSIHDLNLARRFATHAIVLAGDGGVPVVGPVERAMAETTLSSAFGHRLRRAELDAAVVYLPE
jgi:ABC-type cobalamin/Fe3+-siderophores transport system ATPase subunit